ncbi:sigma-54-dependent transcriptional regulator [Varunaivibrio sulfuroxidans]|uniref:DNA-binding NtrC family response regulator n=1 Tax=Varunaivibrio sulfuroxidans TaxID=1773489 RepID=A0A4R3J9N4_9PROT|nr:sigma-54 dependent transcriptional regulator [Varunaivibrio sulfuroxidans]TCS62214.1 DNA-binding NtrC family response regulator [Varunaivibrio sulfuroxidans]WES30639.1 sigma-54 dependent transcriptional regulator [Varunaivibrio sulfuroxidans]
MVTYTRPRVLLVEDTIPLARTYISYLKNEPYDVTHVATGDLAMRALEREPPEVVLLDLMLPDMNGLDILRHVGAFELPCVVIVITANASVNTAVEAMHLGAADFLLKPFSAGRLTTTIKNALERHRLTKIVETYQKDIDRQEYCGFIGSSLAMQAVYRIIDSAAPSKATVFITGESGTGKEVTAEAVHNQSPRKDRAFVAINCGAIPRDLMESEIFGHVKGAFTGALSEREGAARRAEGGTLFLDEICEMDMDLQTKLLRFIQTGTFQKVGGGTLESVDIRFVCATNKDPMEEVAAGRFREDLFYRLHVIPVHLPPLRERESDVLSIAQFFLDRFAQEEGKKFERLAPDVTAVFLRYPWPGNVRQVQNVLRNIVVLNDGAEIDAEMLPAPLDEYARNFPRADAGTGLPPTNGAAPTSEEEDRAVAVGVAREKAQCFPIQEDDIRPLEETERVIIEHAIALCGDNVPKAAARLGVSASTLYRKRAGWDEE